MLVGDDEHSLYLGGECSDEERGGQTPPREGNDRSDFVVVLHSTGPS